KSPTPTPPQRYLFFFFQAEDGIRDFHVTGVQTCALPILIVGACAAGNTQRKQPTYPSPAATDVSHAATPDTSLGVDPPPHNTPRSEERRVGKAWRAGRATGREKQGEQRGTCRHGYEPTSS